jgi:hypothetical protein
VPDCGSQDRDLKMIILLEYLCRSGIQRAHGPEIRWNSKTAC